MADTQPLAERYVLLGLALGEHVDGLVDSYFGPAELQDGIASEPPTALLDEARSLRAELDGSDGEPQRRRWLSAQVGGLECVAELLADEQIPWREAVKRCYGVEVEPVPEDRFARRCTPGSTPQFPVAAASPSGSRRGTRLSRFRPRRSWPRSRGWSKSFGARRSSWSSFPTGEELEVELVTGKAWSAYNAYLGDLKSRIEINIDLPIRSYFLAHLAAHEVYPGHHTERACKEAGLLHRLGRVEAAISLIHTPECLVAEGIAQVALEQAFGAQWLERVAGILRPYGVPLDVEVARVVVDAYADLEAVEVNVACHSAEGGWTVEEAVAYHRRWRLSEGERARKSVEFATHPMWSLYVPTYSHGQRLARHYAATPGNFRRLLTEQLTTGDLLEASRGASG